MSQTPLLKKQIQQQLQQRRYCAERGIRGLTVVAGSARWCEHVALRVLLAFHADTSAAWVSDDLPELAQKTRGIRHVHRGRSIELLGNDCGNLVVNMHDGLDLNLLGRVANTLQGGGTLFLLSPEFSDWIHTPDPLFQMHNYFRQPEKTLANSDDFESCTVRRLTILLNQYIWSEADKNNKGKWRTKPYASFISQADSIGLTSDCLERDLREQVVQGDSLTTPAGPVLSQVADCLPEKCEIVPGAEQTVLIEKMHSAATLAHFYLFVVADRGRGKSTALGIGAAGIMQAGVPVIITASHKRQTENFFKGFRLAPTPNNLDVEPRYLPPDLLARELFDLPADALLIIEEAASIALPLLQKLCEVFPRIIFSSTVQGYEGSGRGFYAKFKQALVDSDAPVSEFRLLEPRRWSADCRLEGLVNAVTGIYPPSQSIRQYQSADEQGSGSYQLLKINARELIKNEPCLHEALELLASAHYQTQPNDVRFILDAKYAHLWLALGDDGVAGVLLAVEEGGLSSECIDLSNAIVTGQRRPPGNLVAQKMAREQGDARWCTMTALRVVRIAVGTAHRRNGLGSQLLSHMQDYGRDHSFDYLSSSFGLDVQLPGFWTGNQFVPVFLGAKLEKASGARNLMVAKPLTAIARQCVDAAARLFVLGVPVLGPRFMPELQDWQLQQLAERAQIACGSERIEPLASAEVYERLQRFMRGEIDFASAYCALDYLLQRGLELQEQESDRAKLDDAAWAVLSTVHFLAPDWLTIADRLGLKGRKQVLVHLKKALIPLVDTAQAV